jgi:hypothetical protein
MRLNESIVALLIFLPFIPPAAFAQSSPDPILARFVGRWRPESTLHNYGPHSREIHTTGEAVAEPTLEGNYVEFRSCSITPAGESELQIMTKHRDSNLYRQWVFDSDGYRHEATGHWDAPTSTLRWQGEADGASFVIDDHWISNDRLEWSLSRTARDGHRLQTIDGIVTRSSK